MTDRQTDREAVGQTDRQRQRDKGKGKRQKNSKPTEKRIKRVQLLLNHNLFLFVIVPRARLSCLRDSSKAKNAFSRNFLELTRPLVQRDLSSSSQSSVAAKAASFTKQKPGGAPLSVTCSQSVGRSGWNMQSTSSARVTCIDVGCRVRY